MNEAYRNIEFYEKTPKGLIGPLDNIRFAVRQDDSHDEQEYSYVEVINGIITRAFKEDEIVVKNKIDQ